MSEHDTLSVERAGDALHLTLDRPDRANALNATLVDELLSALDDDNVAGVRILVIRGNGKNFCGGFDLSDIETVDDSQLVLRFLKIETFLQRLYHAPFVTLACVRGNAIGAGADIVAACTHRVADSQAKFRMPGWSFGVALGTRRLSDRVGPHAARKLLASGGTLTATTALHMQLVTQLADESAWASIVEELAAVTRIPTESLTTLNRLTVSDHRDADMAALVASLLHPNGLRQRMIAYVQAATK